MELTKKILIAMAIGVSLGAILQLTGLTESQFVQNYVVDGLIDSGGRIFVTLLKMMVVPLVFVSLVCGAANLGVTGRAGPLGGKTIGLYLVTTALAVTLALAFALIVDPGLDSNGDSGMKVQFDPYQAKEAPSVKETLLNIFPSNPIAAMASGQMLQVIVFALFLGMALSGAGQSGKKISDFFIDTNQVLMRLITMIIQLTPYGVFFLMAKFGATLGLGEISKVLVYFCTVAIALLLHGLLVYPLLLKAITGLSPFSFFKKMREPILVAFSTSSSGATLPVTLRTVEHRLGVKNDVASFAIPLGATINMDGTAIMQGVATIFIANAYGINLEISDFISVIMVATMASIGTAGVPGVGLIMLAMVLNQVGLPSEGIALIIGIDRLLDMTRTAVNITGDAAISCVVASSEKKINYNYKE